MAALTVTSPKLVSGGTTSGTAGSAIVAGQFIALDADGDLVPADNADATTYKVVGMALSTADATQTVLYAKNGAVVTSAVILNTDYSATYYASSTAGAMELFSDVTTTTDYMCQVAKAWQFDKQIVIDIIDYAAAKATIPVGP